jgi:serine/threonine protein kinase
MNPTNFEQFTLDSINYKSTYATLYNAHDDNGDKYLIKCFILDGNSEIKLALFRREFYCETKEDLPHVAKITKAKENASFEGFPYAMHYIVYKAEKTLFDVLEHNTLEEDVIIENLIKLAATLKSMEEKQLVHRNFKPENIFIDAEGKFSIVGFGFAGTRGLRAYETYSEDEPNGKYTILSDIFSIGYMIYMMLTGLRPFDLANESDPVYQLIMQERYAEFWQYCDQQHQARWNSSRFISLRMKVLVESMIRHNPAERFTVDNIVEYLGEINN